MNTLHYAAILEMFIDGIQSCEGLGRLPHENVKNITKSIAEIQFFVTVFREHFPS